MCQIILSNPGTSRLCLDVTTIQKFSGTSSRHLLRLVAQLYLTLCNHMDCRPPGSSVHGDSPAKNTGVDCYALLQGNFHTQESNPGLPHCRQILYQLSHKGSPRILEWIACHFCTRSSQLRIRTRVSCTTNRCFTK